MTLCFYCFSEDYDDLLDFLSDSGDEDQAPKKREKPKIQLTSKSKPEISTSTTTTPTLTNSEDIATQDNGKPITSLKNTIEENSEIKRPRTSRGKQDLTVTKNSSNAIPAPAMESKWSSSGAAIDSSSKQRTSAGSLKSAQVDFDDDEGDDLLSGMGLDDSDVIGPAKQPEKGKPERQGSVLDELLGKRSSAPSKEAGDNNKSKSSEIKAKKLTDDKTDSDGEGESFQFGGYVPSAVSGDQSSTSIQAKKPRLKMPVGRRGFSELTLPPDALTTRPGSAPSPAVKKSVRFADTVETSDRPSSSPATTSEGGVTKAPPTAGSHNNRNTAAPSDKDDASSTSKQSSEGAKKPPLPSRSSAISSKSKDSSESEPLETDVKDEDMMGQEGGGRAKESEAPIRGRGRRTALTKPPPSSTNSLFETNQEALQTTDSTDIGLHVGDDGSLTEEGVAKNLKSEEVKMERPVFPWQKGRQVRSQSLGSINAPGSPGRHLSEKGSGGMAGDHTTSHDPLKGSKARTTDQSVSSHGTILDQSSQLASFQEMLLQQQKQMQEQFKQSLQAQLGEVTPTSAAGSSKLSSIKEGRLRGELKSSQEHTKELETQLEMEKAKHSEAQVSLRNYQMLTHCFIIMRVCVFRKRWTSLKSSYRVLKMRERSLKLRLKST